MLRPILALVLAGSLAGWSATPAGAADEHEVQPPKNKWSFAGPFGKYDKGQLQRGFKVYKEVCSTCHGMKLVSFRNLGEDGALGYSDAQIEAIAKDYKIKDGPNDQGEMFERDGRPADHFPTPYANEQAARAQYGGVPPDMSVLAKARSFERGGAWFVTDIFTQYQEQGPDYITALLQGYEEKPPAGVSIPDSLHYNKIFPGNAIAMPQPIEDGRVTYDDGSPQTLPQYAKDVAAFLAWASEPHLEARKRIGFQVMVFLLVFAGLLYFTKKKVWASAH